MKSDAKVPVMLVSDRGYAIDAALAETGRTIDVRSMATTSAEIYRARGGGAVVVDVDNADGDGLEALMKAVANEHGVALIVGSANPALLDTLIAAGATHWLPGPTTTDALKRALRLADRYLDRDAFRDERRRAPSIMPETSETAARNAMASRLKSSDAPVTLLLIALTRFDMINMAFGRETGDTAIDGVSGRIEMLARKAAARFWRLTGARFAVLAEGDEQAARALAEQIVPAVERPVMAEGHLLSVGCRIGIAARRRGDGPGELLRRASAALAEAATTDGSPIRSMSAKDEGEAMLDSALESDLRRALDGSEIEILFQPQVAVTTGKVTGVEALARWQHPRYGELGAGKLFAIAERSDYRAALSAHVQMRAVQVAMAWPPALAALRLSINVLPSDLERPDFVGSFFAMIDACGFPRERLTVEVTEGGLMTDLGLAADVLAALRAGGCSVAIDDFGTGYSSLAWLKALPLDYLKIDRQIAQDIVGTTRDRVVVRSVIEMARSLGLAVIAEGVETEKQLALLAAEGCNYYQGFLFSGPVTARELEALVG